MKADPSTEKEVLAALQAFLTAYGERKAEQCMSHLAPDADLVLFGTGADERRVGPAQARAQMERDWAQSESAGIALSWTQVSAAGSAAWVAAEGEFRVRAEGQDMTLPARATFVLERRDGRWLLVQAHFSTPAANQEEGKSF